MRHKPPQFFGHNNLFLGGVHHEEHTKFSKIRYLFKDNFFEKKLLYCHKVISPNFNLWIILYNLPEVQANSCSLHSPSFRVLLICDLQWSGSSSDLSGQSTLWSHRHNFEMQWIPKWSRSFDLLICVFLPNFIIRKIIYFFSATENLRASHNDKIFQEQM